MITIYVPPVGVRIFLCPNKCYTVLSALSLGGSILCGRVHSLIFLGARFRGFVVYILIFWGPGSAGTKSTTTIVNVVVTLWKTIV